MSVQRYDQHWIHGAGPCKDGRFVLHADHAATVAALEEENKRLRESLRVADNDLEHATRDYLHGSNRTRGIELFNRTTHAHARIKAALTPRAGEGGGRDA